MKTLLSVLFFSMTIMAHAQQTETSKNNEKQTTFGFKTGLNHTQLNLHEDPYNEKNKTVGAEVYVGLFSSSKLNEKLNIENEVLVLANLAHIFIELPIHLKYNFHDKWSVLIGPKIDFSRFKINKTLQRGMGMSAEIGFQYKINKKYFTEIRYAKGVTGHFDDLNNDLLDGKRNTLRLGLGINF